MDWKLFLSAFATIFLAEVGDKTQLVTMSMAAGSNSKWAVFCGAALALVITTLLAVTVGMLITRLIPAIWLHRAAGVLFIILGVVYLSGKGG